MASDSSIKRLRAKLRYLHSKYKSWRNVAALPEFDKVPPGTLCSIAKGNYEPKDAKIRRKLLLPIVTYQLKDPVTGRFIRKDE